MCPSSGRLCRLVLGWTVRLLRVWGRAVKEGGEHQAVQWVRPADREGLSEQVEDQPVQRPWGGPVINHWRSSREVLWWGPV